MENYEKEIVENINEVAKKRRKDFVKLADQLLSTAKGISDIAEISNRFHDIRPMVWRSEFAVEEIPLTRSQYEAAKRLVKETCNKENVESNRLYENYKNKLKEKFKDILRSNSFSYHGKNKKEVFNIIFARAWNTAHGEGYHAIKEEFDDLDDFVSDITKAMNG